MESLVGTFDPAFFEKKRSQPTGDIITRPFTCIAVNQEKSEVLVGSADHAAYTFSAENGSGKRRLYHRSFGHREWVSSCCFLPDGRPLTGGQDGKLCLWSKGGASCRDLPGEQHSVSQCSPVPGADNVAVSSGYDGSLVVWNLVGSSPICVKIELNNAGIKKKRLPPLTNFALSRSTALSCARDGLISLWDIREGTLSKAVVGKHHGQVAAIISLSQSNAAFATAGSDGIVGIWDMRVGRDANNAIGASMCCSPSKGLPLTSMIEMHHDGNGNSLLAGSVDGSVAILDYRKNLMPVFKVSPTNKESAITCVCEGMWKNEQVAFAAQENGAVSAIGHDGAIKHSFSLKQGAARLMATCNQHLIVTGDDNIARVLRPN